MSGIFAGESEEFAQNVHRYPVKIVRKIDKKGFRKLKKVCRTFMQTSRDEYLINQARALALQEEH